MVEWEHWGYFVIFMVYQGTYKSLKMFRCRGVFWVGVVEGNSLMFFEGYLGNYVFWGYLESFRNLAFE